MPRLNIRLTEEQHEELRTEAFRTRQSIQTIVASRLFPETPPALKPPKPKGVSRGTVRTTVVNDPTVQTTPAPAGPTVQPAETPKTLQTPVDRPVRSDFKR